jgi:hypothetical protein
MDSVGVPLYRIAVASLICIAPEAYMAMEKAPLPLGDLA